MEKRLLLGDNTDFHMALLQNGVFSVGDKNISQLIKKQIISDVKQYEDNIVFFNSEYLVTGKEVIKNKETIFTSDSLITSFSSGYTGTSDGQLFFEQNLILKLSDVIFSIQQHGDLMLVVAMNGELALIEKGKVIQQTKFVSQTRGQLPWSVLSPVCGFLGPYAVSPSGIRMLSDLKKIVIQLHYGFTRPFSENKFLGLVQNKIEICELKSNEVKIIGHIIFENKILIDAFAVDKGEVCLLYVIYEDCSEGFKYAEFMQTNMIFKAEKKIEAIKQPVHQQAQEQTSTPQIQKLSEAETIEPPLQKEKLDYLDDSDDFKSQLSDPQIKPTEPEDDILDESISSSVGQISQQSPQNLSKQNFSINQFFTLNPNQTESYFTSHTHRTHAIKNSTRVYYQINQFGKIYGQNSGQNFTLSINPADVNYQSKQLNFPNIVVSASLKDFGFAICTENAFQVYGFIENAVVFKGVFSAIQSGCLITLVSLDVVCVAIQGQSSMQLMTFSGGLCLNSMCFGEISHISSNSQMVFIVHDFQKKLTCYDPINLTIVYCIDFSIGVVNFLDCTENFVVLGSLQGLYIVDFQDLFGQNSAQISQIHSYLEPQINQISTIQKKIISIVNGNDRQQLARQDLEELKSIYYHPVYINEIEDTFQIQCVEIEQDDKQLLKTYNLLLDIVNGKQEHKIDIEGLFRQDINYLKNNFPIVYEPHLPLLQLPNFVNMTPSPPINAGNDEIDNFERKIFLSYIILRSKYIFTVSEKDMARNDLQFDLQLLNFGQSLCKNRLNSRVIALSRLFRTRKGLEGFRAVCLSSGISEAAKLCLELSESRFGDENFARDGDILPGARPSGSGITTRKIDILGFNFASGNARQKFDQIVKEVTGNVDDFLKKSEKEWKEKSGREWKGNKAIYSPKTPVHGDTDLPPPDPEANRKFLQILGNSKGVKVEPVLKQAPKAAKLSAASGTPQRNQLSLGDALGGN